MTARDEHVEQGSGLGPSTLAERVLARLESANVSYCHWKSNEHLDAALLGETDLDLLIATRDVDSAYRVFAEMGCRRSRSSAARSEPGLEDFFGYDRELGRLVHFHVHWRLATGERHLKRFRLPWERFVLETRVRDQSSGCYVPAPAAEVVLLSLRAALKLRWRDRVRLRIRRGPSPSVAAELAWLMKATDAAEVSAVARTWLDESGAAAIDQMVADGPTRRRLVAVRRGALRAVGANATHIGISAPLVRWRREAVWFRRGVARHFHPSTVLSGRGGGGGGLLVAVIGSDGSGKSTLCADLRRWFAPKYDTLPIYLGSGDGPASLLRAPLVFARRLMLGRKADVAQKHAVVERHRRAIGAGKVVWALVLAFEKHRKLKRAMVARTRGLLVITDRFPQTQCPGSNDGPLLSAWRESRNPILRLAAGVEARPYRKADRLPPDLVIRLNVDQATASARRPGNDAAHLAGRIAVVRQLAFPDARFGVVEIDATAPYREVLDQAISAIFEVI